MRRAQTGNLLFYGWEEGSDHIKAFNTALMADVRPTNTSFQPRYRIEFTSYGPIVAPEAAQPIRMGAPYSGVAPRTRSSYQARHYSPTYVFECPFCNKKFRHSKNDSTLRKHHEQLVVEAPEQIVRGRGLCDVLNFLSGDAG